MSKKHRIYVVDDTGDQDANPRLIRAGHAAQAIRHAVAARYLARPASPDGVAALYALGVRVEEAVEEPPAPADAESEGEGGPA